MEVVTSGFRGLPRRSVDGGLALRRLPVLRRQEGQSNPLEMMSFVASAAPYLALRRGPRPDVAVSFHSIPSGLAVFPACELRGIPHIVLFRGGDVPGWLPGDLELYHRMTLWLNRLIVYRADAALANSEGLRDLAQRAFPKREVGVLCNGVDLAAYCPPPRRREDREGPVRLLFVGRVTRQKGIDAILRSLASPGARVQDWRLEVVGTGPMLEEYRALATELGIGARVNFRGWLDRPEVRGCYDEADMLIFPSRYEGMPNVVLEATACGLPVVGTRVAGTDQIIRDGENGFLVDVDDEEALADRVVRLLVDREARQRMSAAARSIAEREWSWDRRAQELQAVARGVLARRRG